MAEFKGKQGHWVTTESGSHLFIESGGTFEEAVEQAFGKENAKKYKKYEDTSDKSELIQQVVEEMTDGGTKEVNLNAGTIARASKGRLTEEEVHKWFEDNDELEDYEAFDDDYDAEFDEDEEDEKFRDFSNQINELNISDEKKKYFQSELEKTANNASEKYRTIEQVYDDAQNEEFDEGYDEEFDDEWSKWATKTDHSVPENWEPDGWDGDTRFYKVKNISGVESVSTSPDGYTRVYTTEGSITFDSMEEAQEFMNAKSKEEATNLAWERGWLDGSEERAINDMFGSDNDFDNDLEAAFKKHGVDEDAILDELRASGKDYGMSNGDLQAVVEAYVLNHEFDDDEILSKWIKK